MAENELMFFNSILVPNSVSVSLFIDIFTSILICHFSISASDILLNLTILCSSFRNSITSSVLLKSGQVTTSIKGVHARLKSNNAFLFS
jgi:hypothetical protein